MTGSSSKVLISSLWASGCSFTSLTVMVTAIEVSISVLGSPRGPFPSLAWTVTVWLAAASWFSKSFVRSWPVPESMLKAAPFSAME